VHPSHVAVALAALVALPSVAVAEPIDSDRRGFTAELGVGASLNVADPTDGPGSTYIGLGGVNATAGAFLTPRLALGLRLAVSSELGVHAFYVVGPHVQYWIGDALFLGAGAGVAPDRRPGLDLRVGYNVYVDHQQAVSVAVEWIGAAFEVYDRFPRDGYGGTYHGLALLVGWQHLPDRRWPAPRAAIAAPSVTRGAPSTIAATGPARSGLTVEAGGGFAATQLAPLGGEDVDRFGGALNLTVGGFALPELALGLRFAETFRRNEGASYATGFLGPAAQYWIGDGFLGAGIGAVYNRELWGIPHDQKALGFELRAGYNLSTSRRDALVVAVELTRGAFDVEVELSGFQVPGGVRPYGGALQGISLVVGWQRF